MPLRSEIKLAVSGWICISPYAPWDDSTSGSKPLSVRITAATSAGSTPFSAPASRMVSSYSRGYASCRTVSGACSNNGSPRRTRARATSSTAPRLRSLRDRPYLRFFGAAFAAGTPLTEHPLHKSPCLLPEFIQVSVVFHHHVRPPGLLLTRELAVLYRTALLLSHPSLLRPHPAPLRRRHDRDGQVVLVDTPALEEKRYLGREEIRVRVSRAPLRLLAHSRMQ